MANFDKAFDKTLIVEGGYVNHPKDKGGQTYCGIARKFHPSWEGWKYIDEQMLNPFREGFPVDKDKQYLLPLVKKFYKANFWDIIKLDSIEDQDIAEELYDTGVNMGTSKAVTFLQRAYNLLNQATTLDVDGKIGPKTIEAVNSYKYPATLFNLLNILQGYRYVELAEKDPSQEVFMRGWLNKRVILRNQL